MRMLKLCCSKEGIDLKLWLVPFFFNVAGHSTYFTTEPTNNVNGADIFHAISVTTSSHCGAVPELWMDHVMYDESRKVLPNNSHVQLVNMYKNLEPFIIIFTSINFDCGRKYAGLMMRSKQVTWINVTPKHNKPNAKRMLITPSTET
mmetsp:Transcript_18297/g.21065  ORF Transcript_18297/g.21065 Transcript_18297/m.21065 type:complete len:147 (-) Transcript_18297:51-491(-)